MLRDDDQMAVTLQSARRSARISQLELALRLGVSQRHVSFVESGRSKPSRSLLIAWLRELGSPLALRNTVMLQAGYAPAYRETRPDDPLLQPTRAAMTQLLTTHDPMPAMVIDANWTVLELNKGADWLARLLMPAIADLPAPLPSFNLIDAYCQPDGLLNAVVNLAETGPMTLAHLRQHQRAHPALAARVDAFAAALASRLGHGLSATDTAADQVAPPVTPFRVATAHGELAFFAMYTTFGSPQDITLASLRVEHLFAQDSFTVEVLRRHVR